MMFRCCPAMAREQILTECINLSTMELWNSLCHLDLSLVQFRRALKTHLFWRSLRPAAPSDLYFSALTINLLTYLLNKRSNSNNTLFRATTVADALKITVLNTKKPPRLQGALSPDPPPGALPLDPRWGLRPQTGTPIIGSRSPARHGCMFDPHFSLPSAAPACLTFKST